MLPKNMYDLRTISNLFLTFRFIPVSRCEEVTYTLSHLRPRTDELCVSWSIMGHSISHQKAINIHQSSGSLRQPSWLQDAPSLFLAAPCGCSRRCVALAPEPLRPLASTLPQSSSFPHFRWLGNWEFRQTFWNSFLLL